MKTRVLIIGVVLAFLGCALDSETAATGFDANKQSQQGEWQQIECRLYDPITPTQEEPRYVYPLRLMNDPSVRDSQERQIGIRRAAAAAIAMIWLAPLPHEVSSSSEEPLRALSDKQRFGAETRAFYERYQGVALTPATLAAAFECMRYNFEYGETGPSPTDMEPWTFETDPGYRRVLSQEAIGEVVEKVWQVLPEQQSTLFERADAEKDANNLRTLNLHVNFSAPREANPQILLAREQPYWWKEPAPWQFHSYRGFAQTPQTHDAMLRTLVVSIATVRTLFDLRVKYVRAAFENGPTDYRRMAQMVSDGRGPAISGFAYNLAHWEPWESDNWVILSIVVGQARRLLERLIEPDPAHVSIHDPVLLGSSYDWRTTHEWRLRQEALLHEAPQTDRGMTILYHSMRYAPVTSGSARQVYRRWAYDISLKTFQDWPTPREPRGPANEAEIFLRNQPTF